MHELLETRQQERIRELESALACAENNLREKEREIYWWRDTARLVSQHKDEALLRLAFLVCLARLVPLHKYYLLNSSTTCCSISRSFKLKLLLMGLNDQFHKAFAFWNREADEDARPTKRLYYYTWLLHSAIHNKLTCFILIETMN